MDTSRGPMAAMKNLPNELIAYILSFLDEPSILQERRYEDPAKILNAPHDQVDLGGGGTTALTDESDPFRGSIKSASRVCHLWRRWLLPLLFRHVVWKFQRFDRPSHDQDAIEDVPELAFLRFLRDAKLCRHVESLSVIIDYSKEDIGEDTMHHTRWGIQPAHRPPSTRRGHVEPDTDTQVWENNWLWDIIFNHLNLLAISLISSPAILASLLGRPVDLSGAWIFRQRFHILTLSRPTTKEEKPYTAAKIPPGNPPSSDHAPQTVPCTLFSIRKWDSLFLNEGSSVKVYATYEWFHHRPPSILSALLDDTDPSMQHMLKNNIRSFSYVAIFPLSTHVNDVLIPNIPAIERFYIQIVPRTLSFADMEYRQPPMDISDLWMERNTTYAHLVMAVFGPPPLYPWRNLKIFESGDSADEEAWEQAVRYVVFTAGTTWKVAREGMFVRRDESKSRLLPLVD